MQVRTDHRAAYFMDGKGEGAEGRTIANTKTLGASRRAPRPLVLLIWRIR